MDATPGTSADGEFDFCGVRLRRVGPARLEVKDHGAWRPVGGSELAVYQRLAARLFGLVTPEAGDG